MYERLARRSARRSRSGALLAALLPLAVLAWAVAAGAEDEEGVDRGAIRISSSGVSPERFVTTTDREVSWANEDDRFAVLDFSESLEEHFTCDRGLRPELYRAGNDRILSMPIGRDLFALPCPLEPGRYAYRVHLLDDRSASGSRRPAPDLVQNPVKSFDATLVVR